MASIAVSQSRISTRQRFRVFVDGELRRDLRVLRITRRMFVADECLISIPWALAGTDLSSLINKPVVVRAIFGSDSGVVFRGFIASRARAEDSGRSGQVLACRSVSEYLDRVAVGQAFLQGEVLYRKINPVTGTDAGYSLARILQGIYAFAMPSQWQALVKIGDISALDRSRSDVRPATMRFTGQPFMDAVRRLFQYAPDAGLRERHGEDATYLEAFVFGDAMRRTWRVRAASSSYPGPEQGATVTGYTAQTEDGKRYNRCIAYGAPYKQMITISTAAVSGLVLYPAWAGGSDLDYNPIGELGWSALEQAVLDNPSTALPGSKDFVPAREWVFRRFQIPPEIWGVYTIEKANILRDSNGDGFLPIQVFQRSYGLVAGTGADAGKLVQGPTAGYKMLDGVKITEDGFIELRNPAIECVRQEYGESGLLVSTYEPRHLYITLTVFRSDGRRPGYDTGVRGANDISGSAGLVYTIVNNDVEFHSVGSVANAMIGWNGEVYEIGCIYYDPSTEAGWFEVAPGAPETVRDDTLWLGSMAERAISERTATRTTANIRFPYLGHGFQVGHGIKMDGRDLPVMTITSVVIDVESLSTTVQATDQVPRVVPGTQQPPASFKNASSPWQPGVAAVKPAAPSEKPAFNPAAGIAGNMANASMVGPPEPPPVFNQSKGIAGNVR